MKFSLYLLLIFAVLKFSSGSDLISKSCREASNGDPNINGDFCVASLRAMSPSPPASNEELVAISVQITKSNGTKIVSNISNLLKDPKLSDYAKKCLKDCYDLYSGSLSDLGDAIAAFKSEDFNSANMKITAAMDASVTCEDQFKDGNERSSLTDDNKVYFELNAMCLAFINMHK